MYRNALKHIRARFWCVLLLLCFCIYCQSASIHHKVSISDKRPHVVNRTLLSPDAAGRGSVRPASSRPYAMLFFPVHEHGAGGHFSGTGIIPSSASCDAQGEKAEDGFDESQHAVFSAFILTALWFPVTVIHGRLMPGRTACCRRVDRVGGTRHCRDYRLRGAGV